MSSQLKKVLIHTHLFYLQHFCPHPRQLLFHFRPRRYHPLLRQHHPAHSRQRSSVHLPIRQQRHFLHPHVTRRHHVLRQLRPQISPQLPRTWRSLLPRHHVRHQPLLRSFPAQLHHRFLYSSVGHQNRFDLAQINPHPPQLRFPVHSPQILDLPIPPPSPQVPCPVQPFRFLRRDRILHKPLCCQLRSIPVPQRQPISAHIDLAPHSHWYRIPIFIQHVHLCVADRLADRHRRADIFISHLVPRHIRRHFRRTINVQ